MKIKTLRQVEDQHILAVFKKMKKCVAHTANALGLTSRGLRNRLRILGVGPQPHFSTKNGKRRKSHKAK